MAKDKADKLRKRDGDKEKKREKKVSRDGVEKSSKKNKKSKRAATPSGSEDESDGPGAAPVAEPEMVSEEKPKKEKKDKKLKKDKKDATNEASAEPATSGEAPPLFMIDTKPTPVNQEATPDSESEAEEQADTGAKKPKSYNPPPSGLNRTQRRRIKLIERQREVIQKKLGVAPGGEGADKVQAELDEWIVVYDAKAAAREEKRRVRKEKEAARLRKKSGKVLTGRALKERKKQIVAEDKKAARRERQTLSRTG